MGGSADIVQEILAAQWKSDLSTEEALKLAISALRQNEAKEIIPSDLEVALLDRTRSSTRKFVRLSFQNIDSLLK
jgi:proteasome alpha subunit